MIMVLALTCPMLASGKSGPSSHASSVIDYVPGLDTFPYDTPEAALGMPTRMSGFKFDPIAVSPFQPAFGPNELVSIGTGGHLVVGFEEPVIDDPANPFGIDLLVFGNSMFIDAGPPNGMVAGLYSEGGMIEVSLDGSRWHLVDSVEADGLYPTMGYVDNGPYDQSPGRIETSFTHPVDPDLQLEDLLGMNHQQLVQAYDGSGGGAGIDLADLGLDSIRYVRISVQTPGTIIEIDAFADVTAVEDAPASDLDGDGRVDGNDLAMLLAQWAIAGGPADIDGSGLVDGLDLAILLGEWF
ncbi:MAG: hypothetical protein CMJ32_07425 [Phycisphaerae bacterium]|nr:hypothetical protein [Phycisphaerae bacterium]